MLHTVKSITKGVNPVNCMHHLKFVSVAQKYIQSSELCYMRVYH